MPLELFTLVLSFIFVLFNSKEEHILRKAPLRLVGGGGANFPLWYQSQGLVVFLWVFFKTTLSCNIWDQKEIFMVYIL